METDISYHIGNLSLNDDNVSQNLNEDSALEKLNADMCDSIYSTDNYLYSEKISIRQIIDLFKTVRSIYYENKEDEYITIGKFKIFRCEAIYNVCMYCSKEACYSKPWYFFDIDTNNSMILSELFFHCLDDHGIFHGVSSRKIIEFFNIYNTARYEAITYRYISCNDFNDNLGDNVEPHNISRHFNCCNNYGELIEENDCDNHFRIERNSNMYCQWNDREIYIAWKHIDIFDLPIIKNNYTFNKYNIDTVSTCGIIHYKLIDNLSSDFEMYN